MSDGTTKVQFEAFRKHQMGRGFVAFHQTEEQKAAGQYDPNIMFVHDDAESYDSVTSASVEDDCFALVSLLRKFRIADEYLAVNDRPALLARVAELEEAVKASDRFFQEAMPKMNMAGSFLDVNAIDAWNKAEVAISRAMAALTPKEPAK